jgi:hypothetical protein
MVPDYYEIDPLGRVVAWSVIAAILALAYFL